MRRISLLLGAALVALGSLGACSDDDGGGGSGGASDEGASPASERVSTDGVCAALDPEEVDAAMGVDFDKAVPADGSCTYTSTSSPTALTLQVTDQGENDAALVLETMGASCDADTREEQDFRGADGGFACVAGVPNVVAVAHGKVLVLTGNSRAEGVTAADVLAGLATVLEGAVASYEDG